MNPRVVGRRPTNLLQLRESQKTTKQPGWACQVESNNVEQQSRCDQDGDVELAALQGT
jgi:hypothetical protein